MSWLDQLAEIRETNWADATPEARGSKAEEVTVISSYAAAAAAVVPVPLAELALLLPIHTAMVMTVGHIYGRSISRAEAARVAAELGAIAGVTFAGTAALSALRKLVLPGLGGILAAPASFALTWALGQVAMEYFKNPSLSQEHLKNVFAEAMKEGRKVFSRENLDKFRSRYGDGEDVSRAAEEASGTGPDAPVAGGAESGSATEPGRPDAQGGLGADREAEGEAETGRSPRTDDSSGPPNSGPEGATERVSFESSAESEKVEEGTDERKTDAEGRDPDRKRPTPPGKKRSL
ncbi:MAG: DUF697 domain-containing protein [Myxococcota bacterium]